MNKKIKREYHDGDTIEFDFEPNSSDILWQTVTIIGVITGILYEKENIRYKVQLQDKKRNIFGDMIIPEEKINGIIEEGTITTKCNFCAKLIRVGQNDPDYLEKTKGWKKLYCMNKKHHILNICPTCIDKTKTDICQDLLKCPYDNYTVISKQTKEQLEKNGIKLVDKF